MFVRLTKAFRDAIVLDVHPEHPDGVLHVVKSGESDLPVYEAAETPFVIGKIRERILEEVRDFKGTPWNDPKAAAARQKLLAAAPATGAGFDDAQVQAIVERAVKDALDKQSAGIPSPEDIKEYIRSEIAAQPGGAKPDGKPVTTA